MRLNTILAATAVAATALAAPQLHLPATSSLLPADPTTRDPSAFSPSKEAASCLDTPNPTQTAAALDPLSACPLPTPIITTTGPAAQTGPLAPRFTFSWGEWMLPPLDDIWCSDASASASASASAFTSTPTSVNPMTANPVIACDGTGFCWGLPPRDDSRSSPPLLTDLGSGRWGFVNPREDAVTCVGTAAPAPAPSSGSPMIGCDGTGFCWGLPPRAEDDDDEEEEAENDDGDGDDDYDDDGLFAVDRESAVVYVAVVETATFDVETVSVVDDRVAARQVDVTTTATGADSISTLSPSRDPEPFTVSSLWVDGLPPPIPFGSIIRETVTLEIPEHGTRVADSSTWFGPWPSSTELPFVTSLITTPTTTHVLPTEEATLSTSSTSVFCHDSYCAEDGTSYCFYWAGVTAMGQQGPEPGETRIPVGTCQVTGAVPATTAALDRRWYRSGPRRIQLF